MNQFQMVRTTSQMDPEFLHSHKVQVNGHFSRPHPSGISSGWLEEEQPCWEYYLSQKPHNKCYGQSSKLHARKTLTYSEAVFSQCSESEPSCTHPFHGAISLKSGIPEALELF